MAPPLEVRPFRIEVPQEAVEDLRARLAAARPLPEALVDVAPWEDGTDPAYLQELLAYWRDEYDWRRWEATLNALPQFSAAVSVGGLGADGRTSDTIQLHYVHVRSERADAVPLLLLHGWPGSFFEFYKLIPLLMRDGAFHIVAPSLPGYGFSSAPTKRGFGATAIARAVDALMAGLGYGRYIAQGGSWGGIICRALSINHPSSCRGIHLNMCIARPRMTNPWHRLQLANVAYVPWLPLALSAADIKKVQEKNHFLAFETGYQGPQTTKPQTLAYALNDSPAGLAAWISWSDCGGRVESAFTRDEVLTNICIYWFGGRMASNLRLYKETAPQELNRLYNVYCSTPTGVALFPKELLRPPRSWAEASYNIVQWAEPPRGGHWPALEAVDVLAGEIAAFGALARRKGWV
ncbi:hypothetical protein Rsub_03821 [Raphidocelis subcapitata]|uniref:Epoxide hydrolase N-terminal domain-containing protein n=1 Tax=Raphidocelis subcapitata TaxID=307507 RepID=A0A2V0NTK9_9CHLO|nr:hypothetical protein Rsub_03821 [Raphidocelis subcapitata]|eukprot:GBF90966.1 hypothetical protein Rsub_03821 [Raphidocelis subcapitata]